MGRKYIDAKLLKERFSKSCADFSNRNRNRVFEIFASMPAEDVAPVRHARWIERHDLPIFVCSCCGNGTLCGHSVIRIYENYVTTENTKSAPYCPTCGAKMDGQDEEKTP